MYKFVLPVTIEPCEEGGYFARCAALQGCYAEGETWAEILENIQDVIQMHLESRLERGEPLPLSYLVEERKLISKPVKVSIPISAPKLKFAVA